MQLSGAEIVVRCLQEEGVGHVFGYPGGAVLFLYDELFKQDKVKHVLVRHEQAAVHAADAYSRSSQRVGVALVTSGPGVTNAVTGIATAYMDSIPMVIITGQVPTAAIGLDAFQDAESAGALATLDRMAVQLGERAAALGFPPVVESAQRVRNACSERNPEATRKAVQDLTEIAQRIRRGHRSGAA